MKTILITGATGFIGSNLADSFRLHGWNVIAGLTDENVAVSASVVARPSLTIESLRLACQGVIPDAIVHAAGSGSVGLVAANPSVEMPANLASTIAVLEYVRQFAPAARVLALSSAAMYGSAPETPQKEDETRLPVSLYGLGKAQVEQLCHFYSGTHGVSTTVVRLFSVYGPGLRKQLLWDAMNKFEAGRPEFFGTGLERRDWVHIADVCRFAHRVFEQTETPGFDVLNCAAGRAASTQEILGHLAQILSASKPKFNGVTRSGDPACLVADCRKAEQQLGWRAQIDWRDGVSQYANWFRETAAELPIYTK